MQSPELRWRKSSWPGQEILEVRRHWRRAHGMLMDVAELKQSNDSDLPLWGLKLNEGQRVSGLRALHLTELHQHEACRQQDGQNG